MSGGGVGAAIDALLDALLDELAVDGELADERVHLPERGRRRGLPLEVAAHEAVRGHAQVERGACGGGDDRRPALLRQREHTEDAADRHGAIVLVDVRAECADRRPRGVRGGEERDGLGRRARRPIRLGDAMPPARRAAMLAHELARRGIEEPHRDVRPLHLELPTDPAQRRAVVGRLDFDAAVEVHGPHAVAVVAKRLERDRPQGGPLLGKHGGDLALRGAVDARVGPALAPPIEVRLRRLERLEAEALERRPLRVADPRFDFPLALLCDRDRARDTGARPRRSARARRDGGD